MILKNIHIKNWVSHKKTRLVTFAMLFAGIFFADFLSAQTIFSSRELKLGINAKGSLTEITNTSTGINYLFKDTTAPLLILISSDKKYQPSSMVFNKSKKKITLGYKEAGVSIDIIVQEKSSHLVLEIIKAEPSNKIDAVIWGPYPTIISKTVGEVIGVVRDGTTSVGMQVLNIKTLGGDYPNNEGSTWARGIAAVSRNWGSLIQAYSINRNRSRFVDAWGGQFKNMPVAALKNESVTGSKIALFSCNEPATLDRLEQIELAENLPHPTINGVWFKKSNLYGRSYLISSFSEDNIDEMIAYTKKAGLVSLYHEGPFNSWGNFLLNPTQFPNGREGLKKCADKAHAAGLLLGVHTLTNFINTNDPYVTPVPDDRLSFTGSSVLTKDIDATTKEIELASPEYFNQQKENNLHTIKIGKELIRYKSISPVPPYILSDCQRGAFGTTASAHKKGDKAGKLFDHPYNVFFPDINMQRETAKNIATLMNETGVDHLDFDGHEGGLASGQGDYAVELFAKDVYDNLKHDFICGTSISKTFFWHMCSYYNWGEPWYGGFKESMQQYRIDNQGLFERNYMPNMMGWYLLTQNTTLSEMEWMLARAAGYSAGFAMVANIDALKKNPHTPELLDAIREWEAARNGKAFTQEQQERLKDPKNEFHLEKISESEWNLSQYALSPVFVREKIVRQPGEPTTTSWNFFQEWKEQPMQFRISVNGAAGTVSNIKIQIDNYAEINIPSELIAGETLFCDGTETLRIYDKTGKLKNSQKLLSIPPLINSGNHSVIIDCLFGGEEPPKIEMQFKGISKVETCSLKS
jgi:hypothetical protein